jgi:hypothetical protein
MCILLCYTVLHALSMSKMCNLLLSQAQCSKVQRVGDPRRVIVGGQSQGCCVTLAAGNQLDVSWEVMTILVDSQSSQTWNKDDKQTHYIFWKQQTTNPCISHRIHGAGIYANMTGVYCWDPWSTIYSSTMDPSWDWMFLGWWKLGYPKWVMW